MAPQWVRRLFEFAFELYVSSWHFNFLMISRIKYSQLIFYRQCFQKILCKNRKRKCEFKMVLVPPANRLFTNTLASDLLLERNIHSILLFVGCNQVRIMESHILILTISGRMKYWGSFLKKMPNFAYP